MRIQHFFDPRTSSLTYIVDDGSVALVIDPVLDYDPKAARTFTESVDKLEAYLKTHGLDLKYALDTHPHADHLSALATLKQRFGCKTAISARITKVQKTWAKIFDLPDDFPTDGRQFDHLLDEGETFKVGGLEVKAILTEGHTPASMTFKIGDALFVGDLIFMPDAGTARSDFPGGSAEDMYKAVHKLYELPDSTRVFTLHDYQPGGRELRFVSTIAEQKSDNEQLGVNRSLEDFVAMRKKKEQGKPMPTLLLPSLQVNINGGHLPTPAVNGISYLKIPLNQFGA